MTSPDLFVSVGYYFNQGHCGPVLLVTSGMKKYTLKKAISGFDEALLTPDLQV